MPLGILSPPPLVRRRQNSAPRLAARYILDLPLGSPAAGIEIQISFATFTTLHILLSEIYPNGSHEPGDWCEAGGRAALAFILSAAIILSKADILRLLPGSTVVAQQIVRLGWGASRTVWTPWQETAWLSALQRGLPLARGIEIPIVEINPSDWWQASDGIEAHKSLSYLEKQMAMQDYIKPATQRPLGLLAILGRLFGRKY